MVKALGIALGPNTKVFDMMRLHGIKLDYLLSDTERIISKKPTVQRKFAETEREMLSKGKVAEYFRDGVDMPEFWDSYIQEGFVPMKCDERLGIETIDLNKYDKIAITAYDNFHPAVRSAVRYLDDNFNGDIVLGGQIVKKQTIPSLGKLSDSIILNKGSFNNFNHYLEGSYKPKGGLIENEPTLRIDSPIELVKSGLAYPRVGSFEEGSNIIFFDNDELCAGLNVIGLQGCSNGCSYCQSPTTVTTSPKAWLDVIDAISEKADTAFLYLIDNNPLEHVPAYEKIVSRAYEKFGGIIMKNYIDPTTLAISKDAKRLVHGVIDNPKTLHSSFFLGRECVKEDAAKRLGRKYRGAFRNQATLDREKLGIKELIRRLEASDRGYNIRLSYIVGPGDSCQAADNENEAQAFKKLGKCVEYQMQPLQAYPGTECYEKYKKMLMSDFPGVLLSNIEDKTIEDFERSLLKV